MVSSTELLQLVLDKAQPLFARLPVSVQRWLALPSVQKTIAFLAALQGLRSINRYLSQGTLNNWVKSRPWDASQELVLITGGSSGIGRQIMQDLVKLRVKTIIVDIQAPKFPLPPNVFFYAVDLTSLSSVQEMAAKVRKDHGHPTVLINNAGVGFGGTILDQPAEQIRLTLEVNALSHFWTVKEFLPSMIQRDHGHIVTIASMASFVALGESADYSCSKAGALAFHEALTQEIRHWYKAKRVRTSVIHPLWVRTPMIDDLVKAGKRFGQPIMSPEDVSRRVIRQLVTTNSGQVVIPESYGWVALVRGFPNWMQERFRNQPSQNFIRLRQLEQELGGNRLMRG